MKKIRSFYIGGHWIGCTADRLKKKGLPYMVDISYYQPRLDFLTACEQLFGTEPKLSDKSDLPNKWSTYRERKELYAYFNNTAQIEQVIAYMALVK